MKIKIFLNDYVVLLDSFWCSKRLYCGYIALVVLLIKNYIFKYSYDDDDEQEDGENRFYKVKERQRQTTTTHYTSNIFPYWQCAIIIINSINIDT